MRKLTITGACLALLAAATLAWAGALDDAKAAKAAGDYGKALPLFEKAVQDDPASADAAQGLTEVLAGLGQWSKAARAAAAGLKQHPQHVGLLVARARVHMLMADDAAANGQDGGIIQGHAADCDQYAKRALGVEPKNSEARVLRVKVLQHQGGLEEAVVELEAIVEDDPKSFDAHFQLGQHWFRQGAKDNKNRDTWTKAESHFTDALLIDPTSFDAAFSVGHAKAWLRRPPAAVADAYQVAADLRPSSVDALGKLYGWSAANKTGCVNRFEAVSNKHPKVPEVTTYLAWAYNNAGDRKKALATGKKAYGQGKKNYFTIVNWGRLLTSGGGTTPGSEIETATKIFDEAFALRDAVVMSDYNYVQWTLAVQHKGLGPQQREALWEVCWKHYPMVAYAPNNAGLWYRDTGKDNKKSLKWYLRAVEASPEDPAILNDAGLIYQYNLRDPAKAEPLYVRAIIAAIDQGVDDPNGTEPLNIGYRDAVNNLVKLLLGERRKKDLAKFAEEHLQADPRYEQIKNLAK